MPILKINFYEDKAEGLDKNDFKKVVEEGLTGLTCDYKGGLKTELRKVFSTSYDNVTCYCIETSHIKKVWNHLRRTMFEDAYNPDLQKINKLLTSTSVTVEDCILLYDRSGLGDIEALSRRDESYKQRQYIKITFYEDQAKDFDQEIFAQAIEEVLKDFSYDWKGGLRGGDGEGIVSFCIETLHIKEVWDHLQRKLYVFKDNDEPEERNQFLIHTTVSVEEFFLLYNKGGLGACDAL